MFLRKVSNIYWQESLIHNGQRNLSWIKTEVDRVKGWREENKIPHYWQSLCGGGETAFLLVDHRAAFTEAGQYRVGQLELYFQNIRVLNIPHIPPRGALESSWEITLLFWCSLLRFTGCFYPQTIGNQKYFCCLDHGKQRPGKKR